MLRLQVTNSSPEGPKYLYIVECRVSILGIIINYCLGKSPHNITCKTLWVGSHEVLSSFHLGSYWVLFGIGQPFSLGTTVVQSHGDHKRISSKVSG